VQWTIQRERVGGGGEGERRDEAVAMFTRGGQAADDMTRGGGAEGAGQGEREADDTTRGGRGRTTRGKWVADDTTRGSSLRRQKMVEPAHAGVRRRRRRRVSVAVAPGEGGAGTHRRRSQRVIYNDDKDAASKSDGNHDVVFLATVAVGA
jgi:hypothetical protein